MQDRILRIGTRGSPLALAQAHEVRGRLMAAHRLPETAFEIRIYKTSGDVIQDRPLAEVGGKGLFTKEIEEALIDGRIDLAVHSSKDMPTTLPDGLGLVAFLAREDVRDGFIGRASPTIAGLPQGAVVGSSSLRRQAQLRRERPDLDVVTFRGNVQTRMAKLDAGHVAGTMLAMAGLKRLGIAAEVTEIVPVERFLPAVGQGAIGIEARLGDRRTRDLLAPLDHADTATALAAERAFLAVLDGSCRTPIAGLATLSGDTIAFTGEILRPDGSESHVARRTGSRADAVALGRDAGAELKARGGAGFFGPA